MGEKHRERLFLDALTALSREHGIFISGCGCCGSPKLVYSERSTAEGHYSMDAPNGWLSEGDGDFSWIDKVRL